MNPVYRLLKPSSVLKHRFLRFIAVFAIIMCASADKIVAGTGSIMYGLYFNSHLAQPTDRTMLSLDDGNPLKFNRSLRIDAEIRIRPEKRQYGFILRMISENGDNIDVVLAIDTKSNADIPYMAAVFNNVRSFVSGQLDYGGWGNLSVEADRDAGRISVSYLGESVVMEMSESAFSSLAVSFGQCDHSEFRTDDVAPFDLRDVSVTIDGRVARSWVLGKYSGDVCYDELQNAPARVMNPRWLIDGHYYWEKVYSQDIPSNVQIAFDGAKDVIYIVPDEESVIKFGLNSLHAERIEVESGVPATNNFSQLVADTLNDRLVSFKIDEGKISFFDFGKRRWTRDKQVFPKSIHWHHTSLFNPADTTVISFGGYGYYKYNSIMTVFDLGNGNVSRKELTDIMPRYSAASCMVDGDLYIYGGRGSETGIQEISTVYMYDLNRVDLTTGEVSKLGNFPVGNEHFLPAENMIYDETKKCFYVLTDAYGGSLVCIAPDQGRASFVGGWLPEKMSSNHFYRNLFYSNRQDKLYAVFDTYDESQDRSTLTVYSLNYYPLPISDIRQTAGEPVLWKWLAGGLCVFVICAGSAVGFFSWRKTKNATVTPPVAVHPGMVSGTLQSGNGKDREAGSAICLLGGFRVYDRNGKNISNKFTPTLRAFLLLLIVKAGDGKGILSSKIEEQLWGDKDQSAARNNRYVSIRKLRLLLEEVGDIKVTGNNDYWTMDFGEDVYCDYLELKQYLKAKRRSAAPWAFSDILLAGPLLPQIEQEWLDPYKSSISNEVVDCLQEILESKAYRSDMKMQLKICDAILMHDVLNEEAMNCKCRVLYTEGKKSLAAAAYESFCREYRVLLEEDYKIAFEDILVDRVGKH